MADEVKKIWATITNKGAGPRYFHSTDGIVQVARGTTSQPAEFLEAELEPIKKLQGVDFKQVTEPKPVQTPEDDDGEGEEEKKRQEEPATVLIDGKPVPIPEDLQTIIKNLEVIARTEKVLLDGDDKKADIQAKIIAARIAREG